MTATGLRLRSDRRRGRNRLLIATALVIFVFVADALTGGSIRAFLRAGASGMWNIGARAGDTILASGFFSTRRALEEENRMLREELTQLKMYAVAFDILKAENESLRKITSLVEEGSGITAPVASSFRTSPYGTFFVGAGTEDGVRAGSLVVAGDPKFGGFVIGRVDDANSHVSLVKGLLAPGETTDAVVHDVGISLEGRGGGQARGDAPLDAVIEVGDVVTSAAVGGRAVGIVGAVEEDVGSASKHVYIHLPFALPTLQFVYVIEI